MITKHEDHILWVESLVLRNLGLVSRLYDSTIRRYIGILFCWLGNTIYQALRTLSEVVSRLCHSPAMLSCEVWNSLEWTTSVIVRTNGVDCRLE